jgi:molybdenum cofactor biosynthesis enzyme MoaA
METVVIKVRNKSEIRFLLDFAQRIGTPAKMIDTEDMEDAHLVSLIEQGMQTECVGRNEVMKALSR